MDLSRNQSAVSSGGLHSSQEKQQTQNMLASKLFVMFNTTYRWL